MPNELIESILKFRDAYRFGDTETMEGMKADSLSNPRSDFEIIQDEPDGIVFWRPKGVKLDTNGLAIDDSLFHVRVQSPSDTYRLRKDYFSAGKHKK